MGQTGIVHSFFWTALETYSTQGIAFIVSIFMARILSPADYGVLGIIGIFIALSDTLIDSGFTNALIKKKDCTNKDYSTVFYFNIGISIIFFCILFFAAPFIAEFYDDAVLTWTTRAMALSFVISSIGAVPMTMMTKELKFKAKAIISFTVSISSGVIGICLAYNGFGVWALVWQTVLSVLIRVIIYVVYVRWVPLFVFSRQSFNELFGFGSKLLGSNIIFTLYNNIYSLVVGKVFNPTQLGYFTRADGYSRLIPINISGVLSKILLPILSKIQDDDEELIILHQKFVIVTSVFIFPGCLFLAGLASPLVYLLISEKWMPIVSLLQVLSLAGIFDHFSSINGNFILAKGRSDFFLKMHVITKPIGIVILIISVLMNLQIVAWGKVLYSVMCFVTGYYYLKKVLNISLKSSLRELVKLFMIAFVISIIEMNIFNVIEYTWLSLIIVSLVSILIYIGCVALICPQSFILVKKMIRIRR